jgi:hypothetical protein
MGSHHCHTRSWFHNLPLSVACVDKNLHRSNSATYICYAEGKTAPRVISARQDIYNGRSGLFTRGASVYDASDVRMSTPAHIYRSNRMDDDDGIATNRSNVLNLKTLNALPSRAGRVMTHQIITIKPQFQIVPVSKVPINEVVRSKLTAHATCDLVYAQSEWYASSRIHKYKRNIFSFRSCTACSQIIGQRL